jgi:hypothetical protein
MVDARPIAVYCENASKPSSIDFSHEPSRRMTTPSAPPSPQARLMEMATGFFLSRLVHVAAELGIADHLASGPKSADELAPLTRSDATTLYRFLRTLTNFDLVTLLPDTRFASTPLLDALRIDAPGYVHSAVLTLGSRAVWNAWSELSHSVATGQCAFEKANGKMMFDFLGDHPDDAQRFSETMLAVHSAEPAAIAEAYDFSSAGLVVDIGGASGAMLANILAKHANTRGLLFDLEQATGGATELLRRFRVDTRVTFEHGSFFDAVPAGGDVYILSHIIHDWDDEKSLVILRNCRAAMGATSRLLIVELVLRDGSPSGYGSADISMLVLAGGAERTLGEFEALLAKAGLQLTRVIPTTTNANIIEARAI